MNRKAWWGSTFCPERDPPDLSSYDQFPRSPHPEDTLPILPQDGLNPKPVVRKGDASSPAAQALFLLPLLKGPACPMTEPMDLCGEQAGALGNSGGGGGWGYLVRGLLLLCPARLSDGTQQLFGPHVCVQEWHRLSGHL